MTFEPNSTELTVAKQVARQVGNRWSLVDNEDVQQELLLWICEHPTQCERWRELENGKAVLATSLRRIAVKYCAKETATRQGRSMERDNFYTPEVVARALPFLFEDWPVTKVRQDPQTGRPIERQFHSNDALAILADLQRAFNSLPPQNRLVLEMRFQEDLTIQQIGKRLGITHQSVDHALSKSFQLISEFLSR
jgi:RNA polymerase sigma factor (sigma-70 family)